MNIATDGIFPYQRTQKRDIIEIPYIPSPQHRKFMIKWIVTLCSLWLFSACGMVEDHFNQPADTSDTTEIIFEVPKGSTAKGLGTLLTEAHVIDDPDGFVNYVRLSKKGGCLKAGKFRVHRAMRPEDILSTVCGVPLANDKPFTVVEGWRIREIDAALAKEGWIQAGEYKALAETPSAFTAPFTLPSDTLEGYLYPETYMLSPDRFDCKQFIQRQINMLRDTFYLPNEAAISTSTRTFAELIIVASLLEREEPKEANRPLVAGIIWKRLDNKWNLGIDATSHYTLQDWNDRAGLLRNLKDTSDLYNTRLRQGLPPTAIGSPSLPSLTAALSPETSEFWYYLHDNQQNIHPAKDAAGHEKNRKKYNVY